MKLLIIEDEIPAAKRLISLIKELEPRWDIIRVIDSVDDAVQYLADSPSPDLIFMDIQLADGFSFDIFEQVKVEAPVIFATAFDEYAVKAFQVNGIDYLLKPIEKKEIQRAIEKFKRYYGKPVVDYTQLLSLLKNEGSRDYKERFLIKIGDQMKYVHVADIAYFLSDGGYAFIITHKNDRFITDHSLEYLKDKLDPSNFFQINRKMIVGIQSVDKISTWFNSRLKLDLRPSITEDVIVSRERVKGFKQWLDR